jgi:hypothetical protein
MTYAITHTLWWLRSLHPRWRMKHQHQAIRQVNLQTSEYWRCDLGLRLLGTSNGLSKD